ncbi:hypothetical protein ACH4OW_23975 [Streptomyces sp. NPDC017056]|uniref:hypothetical protein n=1 Tax=Streptomyces sp. NPDC017056 TaxID=3364973 RepID=UPI00378A9CED
MTAADYTPSDVTALVKQWVKQARADAKAAGDRPMYYSGLSDTKRSKLYRESEYWHALASGGLLELCVQPRPTAANLAAMRTHLAESCERLHAMMNTRGDMLPEGTRDQVAVIEQRIGMSLDVVERAGEGWGREADAAWLELMRWATCISPARYDRFRGPRGEWEPDGWRAFSNLI